MSRSEAMGLTDEQLEIHDRLLAEAWQFMVNHNLAQIGGLYPRREALPGGGYGRIDYTVRIVLEFTTPLERAEKEMREAAKLQGGT